MCCAMPSPATCCRMAPTCGSCRSFWAIPTSRRPRSTPMCWMSASRAWCATCILSHRARVRLGASPPHGALERSLEHEKGPERDEAEPDGVVPGQRLLEVGRREHREDQEGDDLLHGLELRRVIDRMAHAVCRDREAILDERDSPAHEDDEPERPVCELQMPIPGEG